MNAISRPKVGAEVGVDHAKYPGTWIVKSNSGPANAVLEPKGGGRSLRAPYTMLTEAPVTLADGTTLTEVPVPVFFEPGELIRIADGSKQDGIWVVIADKGGDRVNLAKLGGDNGRYLRAARRGLTKVTFADVLREMEV